jgi:NitT/TauT family transport system substrate-binding protein
MEIKSLFVHKFTPMISFCRGLLAALSILFTSFLACAEPMRLSISIPGPGSAAYLPIELISKIGADKAEGAEVRVVFSPSGPAALDEMLNNNVDFTVTGMPSAMSVRLNDKRLVALAAINDLPLYALVVRQGLKGQVKSIADLKGKSIGLHSNSISTKSTSQQVLELMLRRGGVTSGSYRVVPIGRRWESESMMLRNSEVDALVADEPYVARMTREKIAFPLVHLGDPETGRLYSGSGFLRGILAGRSDRVQQDPGKAEAMVKINGSRRTRQRNLLKNLPFQTRMSAIG